MAVRTVFFDFDGVILESVSVKTDAFADLFAEHGPEIQAAVVRYHLENLGRSRFEKFRYFYEQFLGIPLADDEMERLCKEFETRVVERVLACPFVPGALEFLEEHAGDRACFVVSATPDPEIRHIVAARGLSPFFVSVHGSPTGKGSWVAQLLDQHRIDAGEAVFVGDAMSDWNAARENGVPFVGKVTEDEDSPLRAVACAALVTDLTELETALAGL
jgi:phosphoglycolate phosphatase-like HAD superfamily hydrolase